MITQLQCPICAIRQAIYPSVPCPLPMPTYVPVIQNGIDITSEEAIELGRLMSDSD